MLLHCYCPNHKVQGKSTVKVTSTNKLDVSNNERFGYCLYQWTKDGFVTVTETMLF
jgi:hypothetical protein